MRENTESSQETRSRIVLLRYGLPCPEVNYAIRLKGYSHVFFADMAYPDLKSSLNTTAGIMPRDGWLTVNVGKRWRMKDGCISR